MDVLALTTSVVLDTTEYQKSLDEAGKKTNQFADTVKKAMEKAAKHAKEALGDAAKAVTKFTKSSLETGMQFDSAMSKLAAAMGTTVDQIGDLRGFALDMGSKTTFSATEIANKLSDMASAGYSAEEAMKALPGTLKLTTDAAGNLTNTQLDNLSGDVARFNAALKGAQIVLLDQVTPTLREFVQFGAEGISKVTSAFREDGLSGAMEAFHAVLSSGLNMILEQLPLMIDAGMQLISALGQGLVENLPLILESAIQVISMLSTGISQYLPELVPTIVNVMLLIVETLVNNVHQLVDAALEIMLALGQGLVDMLPQLLEKVPELVEGLVSELVGNAPKLIVAALALIGTLGAGLLSSAVELPQFIAEVVNGIQDGFLGGVEKLKDAGRQLLEGVWNGISDKVAWLKGKVSGVVDTIKSWFTGKDGFDEHSPSKWSAKVFDYVMQGGAIGIDSGSPDLYRSIDATVNEAKDRMAFEDDGYFAGGARGGTSQQSALLQTLIDEIRELKEKMLNMKIVLDTGVVAGGVTDKINRNMGDIYTNDIRRRFA